MAKKPRVLVVDDEEFNLILLQGDLEDNHYEVVKAEDGKIACDILKDDNNFDVILMDRMMPNMDGMKALQIIKNDERLKHIPIIMQTAAASTKEIMEGIDAGVFYYLTKPYEIEVLLAIVKSAIYDNVSNKILPEKVNIANKALNLLEYGKFKFRTMEDATGLSRIISNMCPNPQAAYVGVSALIVNAIEHGNLGITFEEKTELMLANMWMEEINNRLNHKEYINKEAHLSCEIKKDFIEITIEDQGKGFAWKQYLDFYDTTRALLPNGRGIAMAKLMSFQSLEYVGNGNKVICKILTTPKTNHS